MNTKPPLPTEHPAIILELLKCAPTNQAVALRTYMDMLLSALKALEANASHIASYVALLSEAQARLASAVQDLLIELKESAISGDRERTGAAEAAAQALLDKMRKGGAL